MRYSGPSCGLMTLTLVTLLATGAARAEPYSPEAAVFASFKADMNAIKELLSQTQKELLETRDDVDAVREELAALNARLGSTERAARVSMAGDADVEVTGSLGQPRPGDLAEDKQAVRVEQLVRLGDIAGARLVLQHWLRTGSPVAAFKLAETFDPRRLAAWSVVGLRGDPQKARELYQQARTGGIRQAGERISELR
jgi:hypothetical protein